MKTLHLFWTRRDFRLHDNPALHAAVHASRTNDEPFLPVFILEDYMRNADPVSQFGYPQRVFLSKALPLFASEFTEFIVLKGKAAGILQHIHAVMKEHRLELKIYVNEDIYTDFYTQIESLSDAHVHIEVFRDQLTIDKETRSGAGGLYTVFTPFKKQVWKLFLKAPIVPRANLNEVTYFDSQDLLKHLPHIDVSEQSIIAECSLERMFRVLLHGHAPSTATVFDIAALTKQDVDFSEWYYSEHQARQIFHTYLQNHLSRYANDRDSLDIDASGTGTSRMSLALTWGLLSARDMRLQIQSHFQEDFLAIDWYDLPGHLKSPVQYLSELVWREFYKYLLFHNPRLMDEEFQQKYRHAIHWIADDQALLRFQAWIKGQTGYPIVDAAMHQLAKTGWMHNRSRMIVASVLTKNLGVDWRWGQEYFRAQLIDLDEASNNGGWQWGASVGADPKPIRIFNPYLQAKNYDSNGEYQKKWLGASYRADVQAPIVGHDIARDQALLRYGLQKESAVRDF